MFVGDINHGRLYHFDLNQDRTGLVLEGVLEDKVAGDVGELSSVIFGTGLRSITEIEMLKLVLLLVRRNVTVIQEEGEAHS